MLMLFCTSEIDSTPPATTTFEPSTITRLGGGCYGIQARRAETADGLPRNADRATGAQGGRAPDVVTGRSLGKARSHDDVVDFGRIDARPFDRVPYGVAHERGSGRLIECAAKCLTDGRPRRRDDNRLTH